MEENSVRTEPKEIAQDIVGSAAEVGASMIVENLPELGAEVAGIVGSGAFSTTIQTLTDGLLGGLAPAGLGIKLSFQQKRFERNIMKMVKAISQKQEIIEQRLNQLEPEVRQKFINGPYRDVLLDNIVSENQDEKVQDNINGYINLMGVENPNDDIVFTFFDTLSQMNELDIRVLRLYRPIIDVDDERHENVWDVMKEEGIDQTQYDFIRQKLYRLGMLNSQNEERRDENLDMLGKTIIDIIKQLSSKKPATVKVPKLKKVYRTDLYHITLLGRQYLSFIEEPQ